MDKFFTSCTNSCFREFSIGHFLHFSRKRRMKLFRPRTSLLLILTMCIIVSASIRGAARKMERLVSSLHMFDALHPKRHLVVSNRCSSPIKSILRFYDGNLKQVVMENLSFQETLLTDNRITVALVAGLYIDSDTDIYSTGCFSSDTKYVVKDGLCYKYHFFNASSPYHIDIRCE